MHAEVNEDMLKAFNKYFITLGRGIHMYIYIYMYGVMQSDRLLSHAQGADHQNSSSQQAVQDAREHVRALVLSNPANSCYLHSFVLSIMWTFTFVPGTVERPADISGGAVTEDWLSFCGVRSRSLAKIVSTTCWSGNLSFTSDAECHSKGREKYVAQASAYKLVHFATWNLQLQKTGASDSKAHTLQH